MLICKTGLGGLLSLVIWRFYILVPLPLWYRVLQELNVDNGVLKIEKQIRCHIL